MATHSSIIAWRTPWTEETIVHRAAKSQTWLRDWAVLEYFGCVLFVRIESLDPATFKGGNDVKVWIPGSRIIEGHLRGCLLQTFEVLTFIFPGITYPSNVGPQPVIQIRAEQVKTVRTNQKLQNASHSPDKGHCIACQSDVCLSPQLDCELCEGKKGVFTAADQSPEQCLTQFSLNNCQRSEGISESSCFMQQPKKWVQLLCPLHRKMALRGKVTSQPHRATKWGDQGAQEGQAAPKPLWSSLLDFAESW